MTADLDTRPSASTLVLDTPVPRHRVPRPATVIRQFRPDIQGLRAVAVFLVVLYHAGVPGITGGYVGVDVFFVISGFLITGKLVREAASNGRISFLSFYAGRIRRLLPAAVVVVLATLAAARLWGSVFQIRSVGWDAVLTAIYGINYRLAENGVNYQQADGPESPLQHFWSLAVEEQFYVVWPLLIAMCLLVGRRRLHAILGPVLVAACAYSLYLSVTVTATNAPMAYFSIQTRAWELGAGALLALAATRLARLPAWLSAVLSWAGVVAIVWSALAYTDETPFPGSAALVPVLGAVAVIAAGCAPARRGAEVVLALRPMQGIGKVSYAWYLWHWPMIIMVPLMFDRTFAWWEKLEIAALGLWLAVLTYWIIESPTSHSRLRRPAWLGLGVGISTVVVAVGCVVIATVPTMVGAGLVTSTPVLVGPDDAFVRAQIAAATHSTAVPENLQPSLEAAPEDRPQTSDDGCQLDFLGVDQGSCVYGDPNGAHTVVLVGDSHAEQWFPALNVEARANHWRLVSWTKSACSMADYEPYRPQLHRTYSECVAWRNAIITRIVDLKPDLVLVGQADVVPGNSMGNADWAKKTLATIQKLTSVSIPVTYLMDTPEPSDDVAECAARHLDDIGACTFKREAAWPFADRHDVLARTLSAAGVPTIEPVDWFCTAVDCPTVVGNLLVYRDDSHMSTAYSAWLAPMLAPLFKSA